MREYSFTKQLTWLIRLRWAAITGQSILLFVATSILGISIPFFYLWCLLLFISVTNLGLQFYKLFAEKISKTLIGSTLIFDTLFLTLMLALTGGPANPFSIIYLLHVSIAALLLGSVWTWITVALSTSCFGLLFQYHVVVPELSMHHHDTGSALSVHLYGMLLAFSLVAVLSGYFLTKMSEGLKSQEREIGDLRLVASHHERLSSLTTLSAGAAHELGTPLATISLAAGELNLALKKIKASTEMIEDADLILEQIERCKLILEDMCGQAGETMGEMPQRIHNAELVQAIQNQLNDSVNTRFSFTSTPAAEIIAPKKGLTRALVTLIRNGIDASRSPEPVRVIVDQTRGWIDFSVIDEGEGISEENLKRVGDPFFTTKEPGKGMGLGVFLVKLFATQLGGSFKVTSEVGNGTCATLRIPQAT